MGVGPTVGGRVEVEVDDDESVVVCFIISANCSVRIIFGLCLLVFGI